MDGWWIKAFCFLHPVVRKLWQMLMFYASMLMVRCLSSMRLTLNGWCSGALNRCPFYTYCFLFTLPVRRVNTTIMHLTQTLKSGSIKTGYVGVSNVCCVFSQAVAGIHSSVHMWRHLATPGYRYKEIINPLPSISGKKYAFFKCAHCVTNIPM